MVFHLSDNNEIYKIPKSYYGQCKSITKLANMNVLEVVLIYETLNRKPEKLIKIEFNRYQLNHEAYATDKYNSNALQNFLNYGLTSADDLCLRKEIPIPRAFIAPNEKEKQAIYDYLKTKYPVLWDDCSYLTELCIKKQNDIVDEYKELVKKAYTKKI